VVDHVLHPALTRREQLRGRAEVLLGNVNSDAFHRLMHHAIDVLDHNLGLTDGEFKALTTHSFDQHCELQLATSLHIPCVGTIRRVDPDTDVAHQFGLEPVLDHSGGQLSAFATSQRRGVDTDGHRQCWLIHGDRGQRTGDLRDQPESRQS
jgi:hypothetical protein